jgi:hypothetical protein
MDDSTPASGLTDEVKTAIANDIDGGAALKAEQQAAEELSRRLRALDQFCDSVESRSPAPGSVDLSIPELDSLVYRDSLVVASLSGRAAGRVVLIDPANKEIVSDALHPMLSDPEFSPSERLKSALRSASAIVSAVEHPAAYTLRAVLSFAVLNLRDSSEDIDAAFRLDPTYKFAHLLASARTAGIVPAYADRARKPSNG